MRVFFLDQRCIVPQHDILWRCVDHVVFLDDPFIVVFSLRQMENLSIHFLLCIFLSRCFVGFIFFTCYDEFTYGFSRLPGVVLFIGHLMQLVPPSQSEMTDSPMHGVLVPTGVPRFNICNPALSRGINTVIRMSILFHVQFYMYPQKICESIYCGRLARAWSWVRFLSESDLIQVTRLLGVR